MDRSQPLVSIITIFFNEQKFIREAIESVFAQTYDNWELLLVDDGSSDISTGIARNYARQYPDKVRYLEHDGHENRGMSATRNLGIRHARGEYIAFLDSDDVWLPQKLERQITILSSYPEAALTFGPSQWWHSWTGKPEDLERDCLREVGGQADTLFSPPTLLRLFLQKKARTPATCAVLMKSQMCRSVGGFEEVFRGMYEDQVFFVKLFLEGTVYISSESLDRYRQHADSHCSIADRIGPAHYLDCNPARQTFLSWLDRYLTEKGVRRRIFGKRE
jgi:glycosyltransferase involved in cell wall biosynthesis